MSRYLFDQLKTCDPAAELESEGLIPGTALRPADVLTFAVGHGAVSLDVGVVSPHAIGSHGDCVGHMRRRKLEYYSPYEEILADQNIEYEPCVWSCYGQPHPATTQILQEVAARIARRRGTADRQYHYRRLRRGIGVEIWRRLAKQVRSCWPNDAEFDHLSAQHESG